MSEARSFRQRAGEGLRLGMFRRSPLGLARRPLTRRRSCAHGTEARLDSGEFVSDRGLRGLACLFGHLQPDPPGPRLRIRNN